MSAGIMPDMYRHTARKSTVSKTIKSSNVSLCNHNNNNSTIPYATYSNDKNSNEQTIFDALECNIKLEKDEPFLILPDNEMEEMIIGEEVEQTNEEIISDLIEQIIQEIIQSSSNTFLSISDQITRSLSIDTQDVHNAIDKKEFLSNSIEENVNISSDEMESEQPISLASRSQTDDDIVEIEATSTNGNNSHLCTCQCHQSHSPPNDEYLLFEQALKQTRVEQQQEKSLTNNRLIQTLKRQHEELINIYQQNQKQISRPKIDREQQTTKLHLNDSQIQTDGTTMTNSKISPQQKSMGIPTTNSHQNGPLTATRNHSTSFSSNQTSTNSTFQQMTPRLSTNTVATTTTTTTVTNKPSTVATTKSAIVTNAPTTPLPPIPTPPSSTASSHDIVDLTEEDEDDNSTSRAPSTQRTAPLRQSTSSVPPPPPPPTLSTTTATTATRIRPTNRAIRPNNPTSNGQTFPLRPLPEHVPCDHTIARPQLSITQENATVRLTWNLQSTPMESVQNYEIYAYKQNATATASDWKKIGSVKSMRLPMAVTLKEFQSNSHYAFAVRAVSTTNHIGPFCEPKTIFTGSPSVQPLHTSQLLNVSS